jgi:hypothetical protein
MAEQYGKMDNKIRMAKQWDDTKWNLACRSIKSSMKDYRTEGSWTRLKRQEYQPE